MNHEPSDEALEQWLRTHAKNDLPDNGFTRTVLARLPEKKRAGALTWKQAAVAVAVLSAIVSIMYPFLDTLETLNQALAENHGAVSGDTVRTAGWLFGTAGIVLIALAAQPLSFVWKGSVGAWHQFTSAFKA